MTNMLDLLNQQTLGTKESPEGQWSAVSLEELAEIARSLAIPELSGSLLGANLCVSGVDRFTLIPRGSTLWFPEDAILRVERENKPCKYPGEEIALVYPQVDPLRFPKAAEGKRGLVGVVYRAGIIRPGDKITIKIHEPQPYFI